MRFLGGEVFEELWAKESLKMTIIFGRCYVWKNVSDRFNNPICNQIGLLHEGNHADLTNLMKASRIDQENQGYHYAPNRLGNISKEGDP